MTEQEFDRSLQDAARIVVSDVIRWPPSIVFKQFEELPVPPAALVPVLNQKLGHDYFAFMGRSGLVVKRAGM